MSNESSSNDSNVDSPQAASTSSNQSPEQFTMSDEQMSADGWGSPSTSVALMENPRNKRPMLMYLNEGFNNWNLSQKYLDAFLFPKAKGVSPLFNA